MHYCNFVLIQLIFILNLFVFSSQIDFDQPKIGINAFLLFICSVLLLLMKLKKNKNNEKIQEMCVIIYPKRRLQVALFEHFH